MGGIIRISEFHNYPMLYFVTYIFDRFVCPRRENYLPLSLQRSGQIVASVCPRRDCPDWN